MALNDITVTVESEPYVFKVAEVGGSRVVRMDNEHGDFSLPLSLIQSSERAKSSKTARHLVQLNLTKKDDTTGEIATVTAHTVLTVPRSVAVQVEDVVLAYELLRTYLTPTVATAIANGVLQ